MTKFILILLLSGFYVLNLMAHPKKPIRLPWDSIPTTLPPIKIDWIDSLHFSLSDTVVVPTFSISTHIDTLLFSQCDSVPKNLWESYRKYLDAERVNEARIIAAPLDNMPIIVPPSYNFQLQAQRPDTIYHFHIRNLREEEKLNSPQQMIQMNGNRQP